VVVVRDVEFKEDEIFDPKNKPTREYRLRVYRADLDRIKPIPDAHPPLDEDTDSEIGSVIVIGGEDDEGIDSGKSDDDSDYEDEPGDYPTPLSMDEQANNEVSLDSYPAVTPDLSSESEYQTRAGRATVLTDQAQRNLQRTGNIYGINRRGRGRGLNQAARSSNFAI